MLQNLYVIFSLVIARASAFKIKMKEENVQNVQVFEIKKTVCGPHWETIRKRRHLMLGGRKTQKHFYIKNTHKISHVNTFNL